MQLPVKFRSSFVAAIFVVAWSGPVLAQAPASRIVLRIDEAQVVTLMGNLHPLAIGDLDFGPADSETRLNQMILVLEPSATQQSDLDALVEAQHDPGSQLFHHWLTPAEYGARFGVSVGDLARITGWLRGHGFRVEEIPASNRLVMFSGTAGQVFDTFHTEMHRYRVGGISHIANSQDPQIPAALAGVVEGVVSLHDFRRTSAIKARTPAVARGLLQPRSAIGPRTLYSSGSTHYLFPADFATIYDLNSLYGAGTTGAGTSIAIVGRSNINLGDVSAFRSISGLAANSPSVTLVGANPGLVTGDQDEATLDVEWAGAVAPSAAVELVIGQSTATTDGIDLSAQYVVNHKTAPVVSTSYGSCERDMGKAELAFYNSLWEQAASQGMSSIVASGDSGAAGCSGGWANSGSETAVNGLCSSPFSTCVGGTEFNEGSNYGQYWAATNSTSYGSALSYIPEDVWNESASNSGTGLWATGGGASVAYGQPAWQAGLSGTSAANGMRAVPDVAMSAASHDGYMIYENGSHWIISGTSAATPSFAAIMALAVQKHGGTGQGNANPGLYALINSAQNPFHATRSGNNSVPGVPGFTASGAPYNLATGLGSVDGSVLVSTWGSPTQPPTLNLKAESNSVAVVAGGSTTVNFTTATGGSYSGSITFLVSGLPVGVTARWSANSITPASSVSTNTVTLTLTASATAAIGPTSIVFTAVGDGLASAQSLTVVVQPRLGCGSRSILFRCGVPVRAPLQ